MVAALAALPKVRPRVPTVLVAGTNGKGSTTGHLWRLMVAAGERAGIYTSPHLWSFAERIQHSERRFDDRELVQDLARLQAELPPDVERPLSFFELTTLLAFWEFHRLGSTALALEVGLGGRWDATNSIEPDVAVITSIGLDHQEFLGDTTTQVAREKAGIMRSGRPVVWGGASAGDAAAHATILAEAAAKGAELVMIGREIAVGATRVVLRLPRHAAHDFALPADLATGPSFLKRNFALAAAAFLLLRGDAALERALARLAAGGVPMPPSLVARFQRVSGGPPGEAPRPLLLDVGHNPDGARALVAGLGETGLLAHGKLPGLVSILRDKDLGGVLDVLRSALDPLILFAGGGERGLRPGDVPDRHRDLRFASDATAAFRALPADDGRPTVVTGSVHAVGGALNAFGQQPL